MTQILLKISEEKFGGWGLLLQLHLDRKVQLNYNTWLQQSDVDERNSLSREYARILVQLKINPVSKCNIKLRSTFQNSKLSFYEPVWYVNIKTWDCDAFIYWLILSGISKLHWQGQPDVHVWLP